MFKREFLMVALLVALAGATDADDVEQKKRGAGKPTALNAIPTGAQKPDYTYSIYAPNPQNPSYQQPVSNSFYPSQGNQYYSGNNPSDSSASYAPQPQLNLLPPPSSSQLLPYNFLSNPGYQSNFKIIPSKSANGNIQLAIIPHAGGYPSPSILPYPPSLFSPNPGNQVNPQNLLGSYSLQGHFAPNYQPVPVGGSYLGQPSAMVLLAQPNHSLYNNYNNVVYPNPVQSFYNYYPSNSQAKYLSYGSPQQTQEYEKLQAPASPSIAKEENDVTAHSSDYIASSSDPNQSYKSSYSPSRSSSYTKLK